MSLQVIIFGFIFNRQDRRKLEKYSKMIEKALEEAQERDEEAMYKSLYKPAKEKLDKYD